jgi:FkbM family methyltransferase
MNPFAWLKSKMKKFITGSTNIRLDGIHHQLEMLTTQVRELQSLLTSRTNVLGHNMYLDPNDKVVSPTLLHNGCFEPLETELVMRVVRPGDVVLDLGANIGYYTLLFARLVGERGKVIAFEPDPNNFKLLHKNVCANGYQNVILLNKAVADTQGTVQLFLSEDNKGDHRLYDSGDNRSSIFVETITIDEAISNITDRVDLIKMDIQGSEPRPLRGMCQTLANNPDVQLISEFWPISFDRTGHKALEYLDELRRLGFDLWNIDEHNRTVQPITNEALINGYGPGKPFAFTNLYCIRGGRNVPKTREILAEMCHLAAA